MIVTTAYALTLWLCYRLTRSWRIAALATFVAAALGINDWNVRPQAFTFWLAPLFLLTIRGLSRAADDDWLLADLPAGHDDLGELPWLVRARAWC